MSNDVTPNNKNLPNATAQDVPTLVEQTNEVHAMATNIGAQKIIFDNGTIYQDNGGTHTVAGNGAIVTVTETTTTITIANPGVALKDALPNVANNHTQEIAGAFANTSQPAVSVQLNPPKK